MHAEPAPSDIDIGPPQAQDLAGPETGREADEEPGVGLGVPRCGSIEEPVPLGPGQRLHGTSRGLARCPRLRPPVPEESARRVGRDEAVIHRQRQEPREYGVNRMPLPLPSAELSEKRAGFLSPSRTAVRPSSSSWA